MNCLAQPVLYPTHFGHGEGTRNQPHLTEAIHLTTNGDTICRAPNSFLSFLLQLIWSSTNPKTWQISPSFYLPVMRASPRRWTLFCSSLRVSWAGRWIPAQCHSTLVCYLWLVRHWELRRSCLWDLSPVPCGGAKTQFQHFHIGASPLHRSAPLYPHVRPRAQRYVWLSSLPVQAPRTPSSSSPF